MKKSKNLRKGLRFRIPGILIFAFCLLPFTFPNMALAQGAGYALDFDGVDDYVAVPDNASLDITTAATVEAWVKTNSATALQRVVTKWKTQANQRSYNFGLTIDNKAVFEVNSTGKSGAEVSITGNTTVGTGWCHIAGVYNGTQLRIYLNGVEDQTAVEHTGNIFSGAGSVRIGCQGETTQIEFFNGKIDEVRVWNVARTEAEIRANMCKKLIPANEANLVAYWKLDESSVGAGSAKDSKGSNDGTPINMDASDCVWSGAALGDESIFALGNASITEKAGCMIDVSSPGEADTYSYSVMQVDETPNETGGLLTYSPPRYWEIWAGDPDFDGTFSTTLKFHYDELCGIGDESELKLYRRNNASVATWSVVSATIYNETSEYNGDGYVEITITKATAGDFSGQYIITSSDADNDLSGYYWTGSSTTDWNTTGNWENDTVPNSTSYSVYIPNVSNKPSLGSSISVNNLKVLSSSSVTLDGSTITIGGNLINIGTIDAGVLNSNINIAGSWTNSETFTPGANSVDFNGSTGQNITSGGASFYNITFSGSGTFTLQDALDINGALLISTGTFVMNDKNMNVAGDLTISSGAAFTKGTGTLTFDGTTNLNDNTSTKQNLGKVKVE